MTLRSLNGKVCPMLVRFGECRISQDIEKVVCPIRQDILLRLNNLIA